MPIDQRPIAVFDSGIGGLTVVRELRRRLPHEDLVYFGDTARVPYGTKSRETVTQFTREDCSFLLRMDPKCIVAACNTASAACLPWLAAELPVPIFGVVEPGASAAVEAANGGDLIAVIATEATIATSAYRDAISARDPRRPVIQIACPMFVPLVEEGWETDDPIVAQVIEKYLAPVRRLNPSVVVLGCTHYPLLRDGLRAFLGDEVLLIDSGFSAAWEVERALRARGGLSASLSVGRLHCYVSDNPRRFQTVGSRFLGEPIRDVVRVCPEELSRICEERFQVRPRASA